MLLLGYFSLINSIAYLIADHGYNLLRFFLRSLTVTTHFSDDTPAGATCSHKKPGRPRKNGSKSTNQRAEITAAAIQLFSRQGFSATTMSEIARLAGLDQSSLYYWFSDKADILRHAVELSRSSLKTATLLEHKAGSIAAKLYAILHEDTLMMCQLPFDFYVLEEAARNQPEKLQAFSDNYQKLLAMIAHLIEEGVHNKICIPCNAQKEAALGLATNEGIQHRFHHQQLIQNQTSPLDSYEAADISARSTFTRLCLHENLNDCRNEALQNGWISRPDLQH